MHYKRKVSPLTQTFVILHKTWSFYGKYPPLTTAGNFVYNSCAVLTSLTFLQLGLFYCRTLYTDIPGAAK